MSRNFTADVDTQREYFNASYFNNSGQNQIAKYDTTLLKPFFPNPDQWKLAINRMRIPLSGIPLSKNNIPFHQWMVGLSYQKSSLSIVNSDLEYVNQYNKSIQTGTYWINVTPDLKIQKVDSNIQNWNVLSSVQISGVKTTTNLGTYIQPATDTIGAGTIYLLSSNGTNINAYNPDGNLIYSFPTELGNIMSMCTDTLGNLYYTVQIGIDSTSNMKSYNRASYSTWTFGMNYNTTYVVAPRLLGPVVHNQGNIYLMLDIGVSGGWQVNIYTTGTANPVGNLTAPSSAFGNSGTTPPGLYTDHTNTYVISDSLSSLYIYDPTNTITGNYTPISFSNNSILGVDTFEHIIINGTFKTLTNTGYQVINILVPSAYTFTPTNGSIILTSTTQTYSVQVDSGNYDIFTYQEFLNKINDAFVTAFNNLKTKLGSAFEPTEPPSVIFNSETKLFSLVVQGQYLNQSPETIPIDKYGVYLNTNLYNKFNFPKKEVSLLGTEYPSILMQNYGNNAVVGTGSATLPQFVNIYQETSSMYAFYDLVRIIVGTTLIPVSGDGEGKTFSNTGFSSNNAINMITDIVPDTTTLTPGSVIIYIPAGILRWYNLYAQQPFQRVDLILYYETKDGNVYPIEITNGEFFSVKLEFKKGPGDF